jgi:hypothetical protein
MEKTELKEHKPEPGNSEIKDSQAVYIEMLKKIRELTSDYSYNIFAGIQPISLIRNADGSQVFTLCIKNKSVMDFIELHYISLMIRLLHSFIGDRISLRYAISDSPSKDIIPAFQPRLIRFWDDYSKTTNKRMFICPTSDDARIEIQKFFGRITGDEIITNDQIIKTIDKERNLAKFSGNIIFTLHPLDENIFGLRKSEVFKAFSEKKQDLIVIIEKINATKEELYPFMCNEKPYRILKAII